VTKRDAPDVNRWSKECGRDVAEGKIDKTEKVPSDSYDPSRHGTLASQILGKIRAGEYEPDGKRSEEADGKTEKGPSDSYEPSRHGTLASQILGKIRAGEYEPDGKRSEVTEERTGPIDIYETSHQAHLAFPLLNNHSSQILGKRRYGEDQMDGKGKGGKGCKTGSLADGRLYHAQNLFCRAA
jgi:hypothetical protein